ncbi:ABC transporter ATP-binding protein [Candidatus Nitrosocosmicus hydrocola]|jgi:ABC-2 type transport system ATP-binding protein|uniref:ABC transporter ATP-binding protein n=1 Tax=Candidatus Nitrosocosmicus hydrocola TaxID=1826872 RepID=UPI0011E5E9F0|nr:ABC transporter ATP-binding protein [Candidatus Nitrosocosmicus hydrocola]
MFAIESFNVNKIYKNSNKKALDDVSLQIEEGKISTLLGRNGAGKTTFIRICSTQMLPTSGRVMIFGEDVLKYPEKIRQRISIVPQEGRPLRALTPWDHIYNWLKIHGEKKVIAANKTAEMLNRLDLYSSKDIPALNLSGGMKQKILVGMAMATESPLLFLDEPTIGLDPVSRRQVWSIIKDWKNRGVTIVLTTHYMDEAEILSDSIFIIDQGKVISKGNMNDLRGTLNYQIRIDIHISKTLNIFDLKNLVSSFGKTITMSSDSIRLFTFERNLREISEIMVRSNLSFSVAPITLDDIFVNLVGDQDME